MVGECPPSNRVTEGTKMSYQDIHEADGWTNEQMATTAAEQELRLKGATDIKCVGSKPSANGGTTYMFAYTKPY